MLLYNGLHATIDYRIAHWFYLRRCFFIARAISLCIAANAVVLREVPEGATVVGGPGRIVRLCGDKLDHIHTPDPVMLEIEELKRRMALLEEQINDTKKET